MNAALLWAARRSLVVDCYAGVWEPRLPKFHCPIEGTCSRWNNGSSYRTASMADRSMWWGFSVSFQRTMGSERRAVLARIGR